MTEEGVCINKKLPKNKRFACVEFPCVVSERDESRKRAVSMLGGESAITAAFEGKSKFMELRFRPESVFAHPAFGERHTTPSLLLHVVAKEGPDGPTVKEAEFKGVIESTFQFNGLCDFQFLKDSEQNGEREKGLCGYGTGDDTNTTGYKNAETTLEARLDQAESLFIPPALFSRADIPWDYEFKPNKMPRKKELSKSNLSTSTSTDSTKDETANNINSGAAQRGSENTIKSIMYVSLNDIGDGPLPTKPPEKTISIAEEHICLIEPIKNLFSERPIWTAMALVDRIRSSSPAIYKKISAGGWESTLKRICTVATNFAYRFISGPWRSTFVRYGFDPRTDSTSAAYQIFDLRFGKQQGTDKGTDSGTIASPLLSAAPTADASITTGAATSASETVDERKRGLVNHPHRKKNFVYDLEDLTLDDSETVGENDGESGQGDRVSEVLDGFKLRRAPNTLQRTYCIADVFNEYIEGIVKEVLDGKFKDRTFNSRSKFGWFTKAEFKSIILTLKRMAAVLGAERTTSIDETSPSYKVKITPEMVPKQQDHHKNRAIRPPEASPRKAKKRRVAVGEEVRVEEMPQDQKEKIIDGLLKKIADDFDKNAGNIAATTASTGSGADGDGGKTGSTASQLCVGTTFRKGRIGEGIDKSSEEEDEDEDEDDTDSDSDDVDDDMYQVFEEDDNDNAKK